MTAIHDEQDHDELGGDGQNASVQRHGVCLCRDVYCQLRRCPSCADAFLTCEPCRHLFWLLIDRGARLHANAGDRQGVVGHLAAWVRQVLDHN